MESVGSSRSGPYHASALVFSGESVYEVEQLISSAKLTSNRMGITISSTFSKERGGEKARSPRRGFRNVVWCVSGKIEYLYLQRIYYVQERSMGMMPLKGDTGAAWPR